MVGKIGDYSENKIKRLELGKQRRETLEKRNKITRNIDLNEVYRLARNMLPQAEIARKLGKSYSCFATDIQKRPEILEMMEKGYTDTREELRNCQLQLALTGHPSMLMWLGKQYLGQADKHEQKNTTEISITVQRAMDELRNIPKEQLMAAQAMLSMPVISNADAVPESQDDPPGAEGGTPC